MTSIHQKLEESLNFLSSYVKDPVSLSLTLGSGLGDFVDCLEDRKSIPFSVIPHFIKPSVEGHHGELVIGKLHGKSVLALKGRIHRYEGHSLAEVTYPTLLLSRVKPKFHLLTNASGGVNLSYKPGQLVMIEDHINLTGENPLVGPNDDLIGPRFPDMCQTWNPQFREIISEASKQINHKLESGVYAGVLGPTYETPSEVKMIRTLGGDMVGMSTVHEAIVGHHAGLKLGGISCITNMAAGIKKEQLKHEDIKDQAMKSKDTFIKLLKEIVSLV